jgi:hypothetical protein
MQRIAYTLSRMSAALAIFCVVAYCLTFLGQNLMAGLAGLAPCVLFFLFAPWILYAVRHGKNNPMDYIKPQHQKIIGGMFLLIALISSLYFSQSLEGTPLRQDGRYIISNHGTFIRKITESEYHELRTNSLRTSSLFPVLFFVVASFGWHGVARTLETNSKVGFIILKWLGNHYQ